MTCPICAYQASPNAKPQRGTVCDAHGAKIFPCGGKIQKSVEQLLADFGIPHDHELALHIRNVCMRRNRAETLIKALFAGGMQ